MGESNMNDASQGVFKDFPNETVNYYAGSILNRYSFLRTDREFLAKSLVHPESRILLFNSLDPLSDSSSGQIKFVGYDAIKDVIKSNPFGLSEDEFINRFNPDEDELVLVFLGTDESVSSPEADWKGAPRWALDISCTSESPPEKRGLIEKCEKEGGVFRNARLGSKFREGDAGIVAMARSLLDWHTRNKYCSACGCRTISVWAGTKRICPPTDTVKGNAAKAPRDRPPCISRTGIHNFQYPRTDPTVIMGIVSADGESLLLGRNRRFKGMLYSCLAGFLEPGESIEEAVRREVWEEAGVKVGRVVYHSSQPWPFPASLMIGAMGSALPASEISLANDPELADARYFTRSELKEAIQNEPADFDLSKISESGPMRLPPRDAIARRIIETFVNNDWKIPTRI